MTRRETSHTPEGDQLSRKEAIVKTGFSKEDLKQRAEGRRLIPEFLADHEVLSRCVAILAGEIDDAATQVAESGGHPELCDTIERMRVGLASLQRRLALLVTQGELFGSMQDTKGREISVKQAELDAIKKELRDWYTIGGGAKNLGQKITHEFPTAEHFSTALQSVIFNKEKPSQFYGRGFSESVAAWEATFAKEIGVGDVALCNSGMSAVELCLRAEDLRPGDTILVGKNFYRQSQVILNELKERKVIVETVDTTNKNAIAVALKRYAPKVIFCEGIENAPEMQVANVDATLRLNAKWNKDHSDQPCRFILDNSFASPALLHVGKKIKDLRLKGVRWAAIESATKYHQMGMDAVTAGLVYSDDASFIEAVRKKRGIIGGHLQERLVSYLPKADAVLLEQKMFRHSMNTMLLATHLEKLGLNVLYPGLSSHPHARRGKKQYPEGFGGVFYIQWDNNDGNPQAFVNRVHGEAETLGIPVKIGVSFGHQETWLETFPPDLGTAWSQDDKRKWNVRVMPGEENIAQMQKVLKAFEQARQKA